MVKDALDVRVMVAQGYSTLPHPIEIEMMDFGASGRSEASERMSAVLRIAG